MSKTDTCGGACCATFSLPNRIFDNPDDHMSDDHVYVRDMAIPLTLEEAAERSERFGAAMTASDPGEDRSFFTCRHWDEETRLCKAYDSRPKLCRDYPYDRACDHGCTYCSPEDVQAEWRSYRNNRKWTERSTK